MHVGSFEDFDCVKQALQGAYGAWINTDGFTVGVQKEICIGIHIFEIAKEMGTLKHYIWSNLDYVLKVHLVVRARLHSLISVSRHCDSLQLGGWQSMYNCEHRNGKGIVGDWMRAQESVLNDDGSGMTWSMVTSVPYMDMLQNVSNMPIL